MDTPRHFAGTTTGWLTAYLDAAGEPGALRRVLEAAGETRSVEELRDDTTWSSYEQFRRLLEAAAEELGGSERLINVGLNAFSNLSTPDYTAMLQTLGSPAALYAEASTAGKSITPLVEQASEGIGATEWLIRQRFVHGFSPFKAWCHFGMGLIACTPVLFGFPPADVVEEACECDGAPECVIRVTWEVTDDAARRAEHWEMNSKLLEARLDALQRTVDHLVSGDDLGTVLPRIISTAARAVRAPAFVLALSPLPGLPRRVYAEGLPAGEADALARALLDGSAESGPSSLVTDVASTRRRYGRLAAVHTHGRFFPQERLILEAFGRMAAAARDSAAALADARRQATTAEALLELSSTLAELASTDEMAVKVARAVPAVVDCDQAVVALWDADGTVGRVAAVAGFSDEATAAVRSLTFPVAPQPDTSLRIHVAGRAEPGSRAAALMDLTGAVAVASLPIVSAGTVVGWIAAGVAQEAGRLTEDPELETRLRGLAGQAAVAISNARLLDQVRFQAMHDSLTALPNRALILDRAEHMLNRAQRAHQPVAALFIDLDNFKNVNDTLGHAAGDELLRAVAARLDGAVRHGDTVGRLGGDEFVVLAEALSVAAGPELIAARVQDVLREPFVLDCQGGTAITVSASIGIATGTSTTAGDLLRDADIALYKAKAAGKSCYVLFEPEMQSAVISRLELEMDLRAGLQDQLFMVYQPVFDLTTLRVSGVEALLRWRHPERGVVPPEEFIPMLEETGIIVDVGRWVLREACARAASWHAAGHELAVSVNLSARQLQAESLAEDVADALAVSGLCPAALIVDVTETTLMRDTEATVQRLRALKELGVRIAVDDFGTGYSSLAYLKQFPVDALKIDRSFIAAVDDSKESAALIATLVQLGRALGLETLAEGIESQGQLDRLQQHHCDSGQGFLLARPLEGAELEGFLRDWHGAALSRPS